MQSQRKTPERPGADPEGHLPIVGGWDSVTTVVGVGGATGTMLARILRSHPHLQGTLVDHPGTVDRSRELLRAAGVADRATTVGQSIFDPLPPGADIYLLTKILNDWPDREMVAILRRCAEAVPQSGRLVVFEEASPPEAGADLPIDTELPEGGSRALDDFGKLGYAAGFLVWGAEWQPSGTMVIECRLV